MQLKCNHKRLKLYRFKLFKPMLFLNYQAIFEVILGILFQPANDDARLCTFSKCIEFQNRSLLLEIAHSQATFNIH